MEHINTVCSLEPELSFGSMFSIEISSNVEVIEEKPQPWTQIIQTWILTVLPRPNQRSRKKRKLKVIGLNRWPYRDWSQMKGRAWPVLKLGIFNNFGTLTDARKFLISWIPL